MRLLRTSAHSPYRQLRMPEFQRRTISPVRRLSSNARAAYSCVAVILVRISTVAPVSAVSAFWVAAEIGTRWRARYTLSGVMTNAHARKMSDIVGLVMKAMMKLTMTVTTKARKSHRMWLTMSRTPLAACDILFASEPAKRFEKYW